MLSMLFGMVTVVLVGILVFRMYDSKKPSITDESAETKLVEMIGDVEVTTSENGEKMPAKLAETYTVAAGDHLWSIAEANYGSGYNWVDIASENELAAPYTIAEGQELKLPKVAVIELEVEEAVAMAPEPTDKIEGSSYTVLKGDTLWDICVRAYSDGYRWSEVATANELVNANIIEVGQVIKLAR